MVCLPPSYEDKLDMIVRIAVVVALCAAMLGSKDAWSHHAFGAEFDPNRPLVLRGPVTKVEWVNPHAWIHLEHTTEDGEKEQWMVEGGTPNTPVMNVAYIGLQRFWLPISVI